MSQSRLHSALESVANVLVGYGVAVLSNVIVFPWFDIHVSIEENLMIGAIMTAISLIRSYCLRRLFNRTRA